MQPISENLSAAEFGLTKSGYTVEETLKLVPFGRTTLWGFISSSELPVMRFGRRVSIAAADIADLLNRHRTQATSREEVA